MRRLLLLLKLLLLLYVMLLHLLRLLSMFLLQLLISCFVGILLRVLLMLSVLLLLEFLPLLILLLGQIFLLLLVFLIRLCVSRVRSRRALVRGQILRMHRVVRVTRRRLSSRGFSTRRRFVSAEFARTRSRSHRRPPVIHRIPEFAI